MEIVRKVQDIESYRAWIIVISVIFSRSIIVDQNAVMEVAHWVKVENTIKKTAATMVSVRIEKFSPLRWNHIPTFPMFENRIECGKHVTFIILIKELKSKINNGKYAIRQ